jgi:hypothetical protein
MGHQAAQAFRFTRNSSSLRLRYNVSRAQLVLLRDLRVLKADLVRPLALTGGVVTGVDCGGRVFIGTGDPLRGGVTCGPLHRLLRDSCIDAPQASLCGTSAVLLDGME